MHMADALLSPAVGATLWAGSLAAIGFSSKKLNNRLDSKTIPLMGVTGAFIFAAQMINFTIPGTGSSGHLGGGMILAILLGPYASFIVMASVLMVQALFFADGGLLALGCNIWNLGIYPCFLAYPLIYKPLAGDSRSIHRTSFAAIAGVVFALQAGSFSVVLETLLSGKSELPFQSFLLMMQPIHLAIGLIEGIVTAGIVTYVQKTRPELVEVDFWSRPLDSGVSLKKMLIVFAAGALLTGGVLSWFASTHPDGLEWSISKITGKGELQNEKNGLTDLFHDVQKKTAVLPDYNFKSDTKDKPDQTTTSSWPGIDAGASFSGILGAALVLIMIVGIAFSIRLVKRMKS